jgi:hypothetical protein
MPGQNATATPPVPASPRQAGTGGPQPSASASGAGSVPLPPAPPVSEGPKLCGKPHQYKTAKGEERTRPCLKAVNHSGTCSSRKQGKRVDLSVLKDASLAAEEVPGDELLEVVTDRVRSAQQIQVDADVKASHERWVKAGKPSGFNDAIKLGAASRYRCAPEQVAAIRALLRRAENAPGNSGIHVRIAPVKKHVDGTSMLYYVSVNKTGKNAASTTTSTTPAK